MLSAFLYLALMFDVFYGGLHQIANYKVKLGAVAARKTGIILAGLGYI